MVIICQLFDLFVLKFSWICSWLFDFFTPWLIWLICTLFVVYLNDYMTLDYLWLFANDYLWLFEFVDYLWLFVSLIICTYLKFQLFEAYLWLLCSDLFVIIWENNRRIREMRLHQLGLQLGLRYNYKTFYESHSSGPITASGDQKCWWWKHVGFLLLWEGMTCMEQSVECFCEKTVFKGELWSFCMIFSARKGDVDRNLNPREIQGPEKLRKACLQGIGSI